MVQSLFMTKWDLYQGSIGRSGDVTSSRHCCVIYGWVWGQNIMLVCHWWYVVQFIAFPRGLELLPCIIEFEDFIYSCKTWDFADWSRVVISFDRRVRPSSKHYTPASLWIVYFYEHRFRASVYSNSGSTSDSTSVHFKTRTSVLTTSEPLVAGSISSEVTYDALSSEKGVLYHSELMLPYSENTSILLGLRMVNMCACMCAAYITYSIEVWHYPFHRESIKARNMNFVQIWEKWMLVLVFQCTDV